MVLLIILASCQTNVVEYPVFSWEKEFGDCPIMKFDNYQFNELCNKYIKTVMMAFADHSSSDYYVIDVSQCGDSVKFMAWAWGFGLLRDDIVRRGETNRWGVITYVPQKNPKRIKQLFFPCTETNLKFMRMTRHSTIMKPQYVKLTKYSRVFHFDWVTMMRGFVLKDSLNINELYVDNKKIDDYRTLLRK